MLYEDRIMNERSARRTKSETDKTKTYILWKYHVEKDVTDRDRDKYWRKYYAERGGE